MSAYESSDAPQSQRVATAPSAGQTGSGGEGPDSDAVQRAKAEIQSIIRQIGELSRSDVSPDRYYEEFLNKVVSALAAIGGAVWTVSDAGQLQLAYQINLRQTGLAENPIAQAQHGRLLHRVLTAPPEDDVGEIIAPHSGFNADGALVESDADEQAPANATDYLLVLAPVHNDQGAQGIVEVFQRPGGRQQVQRGYLRFLQQTCQLAGDYLRSRRLTHLADKQSLWEQLESFTRTAHEQLDVRQTAFSVANEGRRLIGSDRVTVVVGRGSRPKIEAVSGLDTFDTRSNTATLLTKLARAVAKTGDDVWYTGDTTDLAPQVERALDAYVDESHTKAMAILPLIDQRGVDPVEEPDAEERLQRKRDGEVLGAIIVEQMVDNRIAEGFTQRVEVVRSHSSTAIANAMEHEGLFLMPVWKALGRATWMFRGRALPKTALVLSLIVGLIAAALLVQKDFTLEGDGKLRPQDLRYVFAQVDGEVQTVLVRHEDRVAAGQPVVELQSIDLDKDLTTARGQVQETVTEMTTLQRELIGTGGDRVTGDDRRNKEARLTKLSKQAETQRRELDLLEQKQDRLTVASPIDGVVITWKVEEHLQGRPIQRGQSLMEVANPEGEWILEVTMPEKRLGHINKALRESENDEIPVSFIFATNTEMELAGRLTKANVAASAEVRGEDGNTVLLTVLFDQDEFREAVPNPKVGAEVRAKVACGRASLAYAYLHDLLDFIRAKILFRI